MASESERNSSNDRAALPFEPKGARRGNKEERSVDGKAKDGKAKKAKAERSAERSKKRKAKKTEGNSSQAKISDKAQARVDAIRASNRKKADAKANKQQNGGKSQKQSADSGSIPEAVSRRMLRRMAILSLTPIALGVGIFFLSYYLLSHQIVEFAPVVVLLTTMGCFGLGVLGLTYGVLSASWDDEPGSLVGLDEFKLNFGRVMDARRATKASKG
ncbi:MAG: PAM68 family protein [Cyanobacteria bacterium J06627_28]